MYKVLIVEDEVLVSVGLRNLIQWSDMEMAVIGEARNGMEGLEIYRKEKPDIILADIKMPVMSGLDMIEEIRKRDTKTKIVVLSCYEDFDLVRRAFQMGISDYIPKMKMTTDEMEKVICSVYQELLSESAVRGEEDPQQEDLLVKKGRLSRCREFVLYQSCTVDEFRQAADSFPLKEKNLVVVVLEVMAEEIAPMIEEQDNENKQAVIRDLLQEFLEKEGRGIALQENEKRYLLVIHLPEEETEKREEALKEILWNLRQMIWKYTNGHTVFGISSFGNSYAELGRMYGEAESAEREAVFWGTEEAYHGVPVKIASYQEVLAMLEEKIQEANWLADACKRKISEEIAVQKSIREADEEMIKEAFGRWIHRTSFDSMLQKEGALNVALQAAKEMRFAVSLDQCCRIFESYLDVMTLARSSKMISAEVAAATAYIKECYAEKELSLPQVADVVGMNKDYLGSLFKRDLGIGFSDYVNRVRINKACELLENTKMKAYEVSWEVGYQDDGYFGRVFKKIVGMSPSKYKRREMTLEDEDLIQE